MRCTFPKAAGISIKWTRFTSMWIRVLRMILKWENGVEFEVGAGSLGDDNFPMVSILVFFIIFFSQFSQIQDQNFILFLQRSIHFRSWGIPLDSRGSESVSTFHTEGFRGLRSHCLVLPSDPTGNQTFSLSLFHNCTSSVKRLFEEWCLRACPNQGFKHTCPGIWHTHYRCGRT